MNRYVLALSSLLFVAVGCSQRSDIGIGGMTTELRENPEGIDCRTPRLSWQVYSGQDGTVQTAWRIKVRKGRRTVWDSGKVESDECVLVPYAGKPLDCESDYSWRVKVWTGDGESPWSAPATWSTGLEDSLSWAGAKWIGVSSGDLLKEDPNHLPATYIRRDFRLRRPVRSARLYMSALGMGEASINGRKVARDMFAHPPVLFDKTVYYRTYDVTDMLGRGDNTIAVLMGCGRYQSLSARTLRSVSAPKARIVLKVSYKGGGEEIIVSDESWMGTHDGPITSNNEYDGEYYDARLEMPGWTDRGFAYSSLWHQVDTMKAPKGRLKAMPMDDMAVQDTIVAKTVTRVGEERFIVDFGQNMVGRMILSMNGVKGRPIVFKYSEKLTDAGDSLNMASLRRTLATDQYTPASDGRFTWVQSFPYHGFRYMQIEGVAEAPAAGDLVGLQVYDKMRSDGDFSCSDERLNRLFSNVRNGLRNNYRGMPIDCPQRDERQGWIGDRGGTIWGEPYLFNVAPLYRKWMDDVYDSMKNGCRISVVSPRYWSIYTDDMSHSSVFLYMAQMLYSRYGDDSGIKTYYPAMKAWFEHATTKNLKEDGIFRMKHDEYKDWIVPPESPELIHATDPSRITGSPVLQTGILVGTLDLMAEFARLTGNEADVPGYEEMRSRVVEAFNAEFFDQDRACYDNNTLTANLIPVYFNIVPPERKQDVVENIVRRIEEDFDGHLCVGNVGMRYAMEVLTDNGHADLAYRLATIDTYPSWGYMIKRGATTVWELWNGDEAGPAMNSGCHAHLIGDLLRWYFEDLAGIAPAPGTVAFKEIWMEPCFPEGLASARASFNSPYGPVVSSWSRDDAAGTLEWDITVPVGSTATAVVPASFAIDTTGLDAIAEGDKVKISLPSGSYSLRTGRRAVGNPLPVEMGDPFLLCPSAGGYYLYGTSEKYDGFVTYRSADLSSWEEIPPVFDPLQEKAWGTDCHWAPEVYERDGRFYLFYSANWKENPDGELENFRIGVAESSSPEGPFVNVSTSPLFDPGFPVIDASVYFDDGTGEAYLYFSRCCYKNPVESELAQKMREDGVFQEIEESWIYGIALKPDLSGTMGEPVLLLRPPVNMDDPQTEWESRSVLSGEINRRWSEGPFVLRHGERYYMIYSANFFGGSHYAMGCAVADSPLGPFVKCQDNPVLEGNGAVTGTGHGMCATLPDGRMVCVYHGRTAATGDARVVFIDRMHFTRGGKLVIDGPTLGALTCP